MKHTLFLILTLALVSACSPGKPKPAFIFGKDYDTAGGADSYGNRGDNPRSGYYVNPDFYSLTSDESLTLLPHFKTMQQTTEWSCGTVCALMVAHYLNQSDTLTEWNLAVSMHSMTDRSIPGSPPGTASRYEDYGTRLEELYHFFARHPALEVVETSYRTARTVDNPAGYTAEDLVDSDDPFPVCDCGNLYPTFADPASFAARLTRHLKQNRPVIAEWSDWDGHWVVIIGIDNNGTPDFCGDDILIFADPYDTSDHWQDGYSIAPLERFFYSWKDRAIAPKPYQLQPYIVVSASS